MEKKKHEKKEMSKNPRYTLKELKNLKGKERLDYFLEYYLLKTILAAVLIFMACYIFYISVLHRTVITLSMLVIDEDTAFEVEEFQKDIQTGIGMPESGEKFAVYYYSDTDADSQTAIGTRLSSSIIDFMLSRDTIIKEYEEAGALAKLKEYLPEELYEQVKPYLVDDYGLDLSQSPVYQRYTSQLDPPVLAVLGNATDQKQVLATIRYLFGL